MVGVRFGIGWEGWYIIVVVELCDYDWMVNVVFDEID